MVCVDLGVVIMGRELVVKNIKYAIGIVVFITTALYAADIPRPGSYPDKVYDSFVISGAETDSLRGAGLQINGVDMLGVFGKFVSRNDSINIVIYLDYSPDGKTWLHRVPMDTIIVSGTQDTSIAFKYDPYADWGENVRTRLVSSAAATDTTEVTLWLVRHYLGAGRLF